MTDRIRDAAKIAEAVARMMVSDAAGGRSKNGITAIAIRPRMAAIALQSTRLRSSVIES